MPSEATTFTQQQAGPSADAAPTTGATKTAAKKPVRRLRHSGRGRGRGQRKIVPIIPVAHADDVKPSVTIPADQATIQTQKNAASENDSEHQAHGHDSVTTDRSGTDNPDSSKFATSSAAVDSDQGYQFDDSAAPSPTIPPHSGDADGNVNIPAITSPLAALRPASGRLVARAAPGATRHLGRQTFRGGTPVRHKFRPTGIASVEEVVDESATNTAGSPRQLPAQNNPRNPRPPQPQRGTGRQQPQQGGRQNPQRGGGRSAAAPSRVNPNKNIPTEMARKNLPEDPAQTISGASASDSAAQTPADGLPPDCSATSGGYVQNDQSSGIAEDSTFNDDAHATTFDVLEGDLEQVVAADKDETPPVKRTGPPRDMLINATDKDEVRIAIVSQGVLEELYMERTSTELHVGNIYKGKVMNVEPAIQAAFIDFGIGKNGFLHISDLHPQYFSGQQKRSVGPQRRQSGPGPDGASADAGNDAPEGVYGDIDSAEADAFLEDADLQVDSDHLLPMEKVGRKTPRRSRPPIQQCLRRGQEIIVQVTKEGIGTKGPTLTSYISVPGRYLVMMPGMSQLGVSRKIEDESQRRELKKILQDLNPPRNLGFIIRTAGVGRSRRELQQDLHYLVKVWRRIHERLESFPAPVELYQESDLVIRTIRDLAINDIDRMVVDEPVVAERVRDFLSIVNPRAADFVEAYTEPLPLFQRYGVEREIEKINSRRVEMANGGSLVIDSTEALVAIDVNSGRYREHRDAELTAFNINRDAIKDICRHLRLRDLGGVIVIDFIDMREERHKREIERLLRDQLKEDRARTKVLRMSLFCMIEMTRQRVKPSLKRSIYQDCPHCHGSGLIKTPESVSLDVLRRLAAGGLQRDISRIEVRVYSTVATFLLNRKRLELVELETKYGKRINVVADQSLSGDAVLMEAIDVRGNLLNINL